jgi:hypothetical protein
LAGDGLRGISGEIDLVAIQPRPVSANPPPSLPRESTREPRRVSLLHSAPALLLLIIAIADAGQLTDPDLWGHIRFGQAALAQHHVILHDAYSYTAFGRLFGNHEWLTEIVMATVYNHLGIVGLKLWKFTCTGSVLLCLALALAETGATFAVQSNILMAAALGMMPQMQYRPQLFTFLFFAATIAILARHYYRGTAPLWMLVPIILLWVNLHGGFVIGIASLGAYAGIVGLQDLISGKRLQRALKPAALALAALLAPLATPSGTGTWRMVIRAVFNPALRIIIVDWHPLTYAMAQQWQAAHSGVIYYLLVLGFIAVFIITLALTPRGGDLPFVVIAAMMSVAAWSAVRNMPLAVIACAVPIARHTTLLLAQLRERGEALGLPAAAPLERPGMSPWVVGTVAAAFALYAGLFSPRLRLETVYPSGAVAFMQQHRLHGNILDEFGWGEYLIWHLGPGSKVFIDGRYDLIYSDKVIEDYLDFRFDRARAGAVLASYPHDFVLIPPAAGAYKLMVRTPGWVLVYHDKDAALFARADSPAARQFTLPATGKVPPVQYFP